MNRRNGKGITLIALVVTIVVLLILAGVTISMLSGDNGIITQAQNAKEKTEIARIKEEAELVKASVVLGTLSDLTGTTELEKTLLLNALKEHFDGTIGSSKVTTSDGKYDILVDDDLNITVVKREEVANDEIMITTTVTEGDDSTTIDLYFEIGGVKSFVAYMIEHLNTNIYPEVEDSTQLESIVTEKITAIGGTITFDETTRKEMTEEAKTIGGTYEDYLRFMIYQVELQTQGDLQVAVYSEMYYGYYCDYLGEEEYNEETALEEQGLRIFKYDGTFEEAAASMGTSEEKMKQEAADAGITYEQYLRYMIARLCEQQIAINVSVSNGDTFNVPLSYGTDSYEVTSDGVYTFTAEFEGKTGETTVTIGDVEVGEPVTNPFDENGWVMAWTYSEEAGWSDIINQGETIEEGIDIIAKLYETGNQITPPSSESLSYNFTEGNEYKIVIEGNGNIVITEQYKSAWQANTLAGMLMGSATAEELYATYVTEVIICDGIKGIGSGAFLGMNSLETIQIPSDVIEIGEAAFSGCITLSNITIPSGITNIEKDTFGGCSSLVTLEVPEGVTSIGESAFSGCTSLENINIPEKITTIERSTFNSCQSLQHITIPSTVTSIGKYAFYGCSNLQNINIPDGIKILENNTFMDCTNLKNIVLPDTIIQIGDNVFRGCTNLQNINIPSEVSSIGMWTFYECTGLTSIKIPAKVTAIKQQLFYNCSNLKTIELFGDVTEISQNAFLGIAENSTIYVISPTVKDRFGDGLYYDSTRTTITVMNV